MKTGKQNLDAIRQQTNRIDFSETLGIAFEIYKKIALQGGVVILLLVCVVSVLAIAIFGTIAGFNGFTNAMTQFNLEDVPAAMIILYIVGTSVLSALMAPITAGLIKMAHCAHLSQEFSIGTAFDYFKDRHFGPLFLAGFLLAMFTGGVSTAMELIEMAYIGTIVSVVIALLTCLTIPLIIFADLKPIDAIVMSAVITGRNVLIVGCLLIIGILFAGAGILGFCFGFFFTMPILYALYYSIYIHSVGIEEASELDQIGSQWE